MAFDSASWLLGSAVEDANFVIEMISDACTIWTHSPVRFVSERGRGCVSV